MSRQRLRPSLEQASHPGLPARCRGRFDSRHSIARAFAAALDRRGAQGAHAAFIVVELPVSVATFLLNEKRNMIRQIEAQHKIRVIFVPNPDLHTPDYFIRRLREEEIGEWCSKLS